MTVVVAQRGLSLADVVAIARDREVVTIDPATLAALTRQRAAIDAIATSGSAVYGVSTGFGSLANTYIPTDRRRELQWSLIRSHAAGHGSTVEVEVVRAMMACRLATLCSGTTGIRPETAQAYAAMLNHSITPLVCEFGSLGCSGDLAPLAHVALALLGEGEVLDAQGRRRDAASALHDVGLTPIELNEKEGLSLINGTDGMLGQLAMALADLSWLSRVGDVVASVSVQTLKGTDRAFAEELMQLRPHVGQSDSAANLRVLMAGSPIVASHRDDMSQVQDPYSLRCVPQVHGAFRDTVSHARAVAEVELLAAIDNPSVLADGRLESHGNFHGAPLGYVMDFLAIALADVASMAERRTDRLMDPARSRGLPAFLAHAPGVDSGLMIAHYTQASIVAEMKRWANPASVDSIPTSAMQEDHVSLGWHAARKLRRSIDGLRSVFAIELLAASRGLALRSEEGSPSAMRLVHALGELGLAPGPDRVVAPQIDAVVEFLGDDVALALGEIWDSLR